MYDIIFISNNEPNADQNWFRLHTRFPTAKRINGIVGIHAAHKTAAKAAKPITLFFIFFNFGFAISY